MAIARLISAGRSEISKMSAQDLKKSILGSEGRVVMTQFYVGASLMGSVTNAEIQQAFGSDMIMLNGYSMDPNRPSPGLIKSGHPLFTGDKTTYYRVNELKQLVDIPVGVYLECGDPEVFKKLETSSYGINMLTADRVASEENFRKLKEEGVDFVVLAGNPGTGTTYQNIIEKTKLAKQIMGDDMLIMAGKWEDGVVEKVIGDPLLGVIESKEIIKQLLDAGADVITLSMPGARTGIVVEEIRELVTYAHSYKPGTLVLSFLDGSIEGASEKTVEDCAILSKQTGADIHCIGDAGLQGTALPENIYAMSIAIKGRIKTWYRQSASRR